MEIVYDDDALERLHRAGHRDQPRAPGAGRPVHRRRGRDRRRRALRRRGALPRRRDGAHRGGRHPLRRLVVRAAADHPRRARRSTGSARPPRRSRAGVGVRGLLNIQFALGSDVLYVLEANPRASRTVPFVSKATATPLAKAAARVMLGRVDRRRCAPTGVLPAEGDGGTLPADAPIAVKEAVMPFNRFRTARRHARRHGARPGDEVDRRGDGLRRRLRHRVRQGAGRGVRLAADRAAGCSSRWPTATSGTMIFPIKVLADLGFEILATQGTAEVLRRNGVAGDRRAQALRGRRARTASRPPCS